MPLPGVAIRMPIRVRVKLRVRVRVRQTVVADEADTLKVAFKTL